MAKNPFTEGDRADATKIAEAIGWRTASIVAHGKGWRIVFTAASGHAAAHSHTKGVPATQLKAWIDLHVRHRAYLNAICHPLPPKQAR